MEPTMDKLLSILKEIRPDVAFEKETNLIDDEILDSFDILAIVSEFNEEFDIDIDAEDLLPENFNSVEGMLKLITKLKEEDE